MNDQVDDRAGPVRRCLNCRRFGNVSSLASALVVSPTVPSTVKPCVQPGDYDGEQVLVLVVGGDWCPRFELASKAPQAAGEAPR